MTRADACIAISQIRGDIERLSLALRKMPADAWPTVKAKASPARLAENLDEAADLLSALEGITL